MVNGWSQRFDLQVGSNDQTGEKIIIRGDGQGIRAPVVKVAKKPPIAPFWPLFLPIQCRAVKSEFHPGFAMLFPIF